MGTDLKLVIKAFSPRILAKVLTMMDKSTAIVVGASWMAAMFILVLAVITVHSAATAKKESAEAIVAVPVLPVATTNPISQHEIQGLATRMQQQFPDVKIDIDNGQMITIHSTEGAKFHQWIAAVSFIDAMSPQYRWTIRNLCVGHCEHDLMLASLTGVRVEYAPPPKNQP